MEEKILEWIHRRFPINNNWLTGNCYQFAILLNNTFNGEIIYDSIDGHFLFRANDGNFYDWSGKRTYSKSYQQTFLKWSDCKQEDPLLYEHIIRDCAY